MGKMNRYLINIKEYLRDYFLENTGLKVLALLITAVLWLSVASRPIAQVILRNVPIYYQNMPDSPTMVVTDTEVSAAQVFLEGPRDIIDSIRPSDLSVNADMKSVEPGVRVKRLTIDTSKLPPSVKATVEPPEVRVTVERVIEKEVPVKPRFDGQLPAGYEILSSQISPTMVRINGAESRIRDVNEVSTETVRLSTRTDSFSELVAIDIGSANVNLTDQGQRQVSLSVNISEQRKERILANLPVAVFNAPDNTHAKPATVTVTLYGPRSLIDAITPADVNIAVDYQGDQSNMPRFTPKVTLAPNYADKVTVRTVEPSTVRLRP